MVNWYYVRGSERVGPVSVEILRDLFLKQELNLDSYVWRKGFQNWERLKDVEELNFSTNDSLRATEVKEEPSSPEVDFKFDWKNVRENEEIFFIRIGKDRKNYIDEECFGPYSLNELKEAKEEKRINDKTLVYAAGFPGWIEVGDTPLNPINLEVKFNRARTEIPLLLVLSHEPLPLIALVNKAGTKECTLLGAGPFEKGKEVMCSIYSGTQLKAKNIKVNISDYEPRHQRATCQILEMNESARKAIENHV